MLTPLLFFTFAGNILPSYVLPGLPALALLLGAWLTEQKSGAMHSGWILPVIMVAAGVTSTFDIVAGRSQKSLVNHQLSVTSPSPLFYFPKKPYSADFYSRGKAQLIESDDELMDFLSTPGTELIAIRRNRLAQLPPGIDACIRLEASFPTHLLFGKIGPGCRATVYFDRD